MRLDEQSKIRDQLFYLAEEICRSIECVNSRLLHKMNWIRRRRVRGGLGTYCPRHGQTASAFVEKLIAFGIVKIYFTQSLAGVVQVAACFLNFVWSFRAFHASRVEDDKNRPFVGG